MMTPLRRALGAEFRRIRHDRNLTLADVAAAAHVSHGYLSEVERGAKEPSSETLSAICEALGVKIWIYLQPNQP